MKIYRWIMACGLLMPSSACANIIFSQDFSSAPNGPLSSYYNPQPSSSQWNIIGKSGTYASVTVAGGALSFSRTGSGTAYFARTTDLSPSPSAMIYEFDMSVSANGYTQTGSSAATWQIGSGFQSSGSIEAGSGVHSAFSLLFTSTPGTYQLRTPSGSTSADIQGSKTITWVINNSGGALSYTGPDHTPQSIASDAWDLWAGSTRIFNDVPASTAVDTRLSDLKFVLNNGFGSVTMDDFRIQDGVEVVPELPSTGVIASTMIVLAIIHDQWRRHRKLNAQAHGETRVSNGQPRNSPSV